MEEKIKGLAKSNYTELERYVQKSDFTELCNLVVNRISQPGVDILNYILSGFSTNEQCQSKRRKLIETVLKAIKKSKITSTQASNLVNRIVRDFPKLSKLHLIKLSDYCVSSIQNNDDEFFCWKDLLPHILQLLEEEKYIAYRGNEVTGTEYKSLIIKAICNLEWENEILTSLAQMFREISMTKADHEFVIRALCDKIVEIELKEIPPLVHQLLRLSNNLHSRLVIETLQKYFSKKYMDSVEDSVATESVDPIGLSWKEVQETESTVLYHIHESALLNHSSLKDFIRNLKNITHTPEFILNPFPMAVLLLVSEIYEDQTFDIIKQAISIKIQDDERRKSQAWMKEVLPENWKIMDIMDQIMKNCDKDRPLVLRGLVDLAFILLESGKTTKDNEVNKMHEIGTQIIQRLLKKRHEIGSTVLEKLTDKIVSSGTSISQYTDCLNYMCKKSTVIVLDSLVWISALLDHLLTIPGESATQVLYATLPLMRVSPSIRDSLVLILRKALYRKGICVRKMAVTGFLQFLSNLKIAPFNLSQSSSSTTTTSSSSIFTQAAVERHSQHPRSNSKSNSSFCQEVLTILTKCFSHEYEVRQHLYTGLYTAACNNPELAEPIIEMLLNHLSDFYEVDEDIQPPLKFHNCSNTNGAEAVLQEPIGDLIFALQRIYCKMAGKESAVFDRLHATFESICRRITKTELGHLGADDGTDLLDNVPKSQQKVMSIKLMSTVIEALIAFRIGSWTRDYSSATGLNSMFKAYYLITEFCKRVVKSKKGEGKNKKDKDAAGDTTIKKTGGRTGTIKLPNTILDLDIIKKILSIFYDDHINWATREQTEVVKRRPEFQKYILHTCSYIFQSARQFKNIERQKYRESQLKNYISIGEILYRKFLTDLDEIKNFNDEVAVLGLECFKDLMETMYTVFSSDLPKFFAAIVDVEAPEGLAVQIPRLLTFFQDLIIHVNEEEIDEEDETNCVKKILLILFEIMSLLIKKSITAGGSYEDVFNWLVETSKSERINDDISPIIIELIAIIEAHNVEYGNVVDSMCVELTKRLGTIDATEVEVPEVYQIFTEMTMLQAHNIFNSCIKTKLENISWVLGRLKAEQIVAISPGMGDELHREKLIEKERTLCKQFSYAIQTLQTLSNMSMEPGPNTEATFKNLHQTYNILNHLTRYFYSKSTPQNPAFTAVKFVQVIQLAGKSLKSGFYNLITHTEENQSRSRKADAQAQRNKVLKETKFIPKVVYEIEQFQKEILQLEKKTGVPLDNYMKHSITRDFRIRQPQLIEGLEGLDATTIYTQAPTQHNQSVRGQNLDLSGTSTSRTSSRASARSSTGETDSDGPPRKKSRKNRKSE